MIKRIGLVLLCALLPGMAMAAAGDSLLGQQRQPSYSSPYGQPEPLNQPRYEQPRYDRQTYEQDRPRENPRQFEREYKRQY